MLSSVKFLALPENANLPGWVEGKLCSSRVRWLSEDGARKGSALDGREPGKVHRPPAETQAGKRTELQGDKDSVSRVRIHFEVGDRKPFKINSRTVRHKAKDVKSRLKIHIYRGARKLVSTKL